MLVIIALVSYLIGSIPFGYLVGKARGVDLFTAGSGNIGATNAGRVLGRKYGVLVFVLDLLKGVLPVAFAPGGELEKTVAAAYAFLGHLVSVFLRFRGGKGVATGAGTVLVLVPFPATMAIAGWLVVVLATRAVSAASLAAVFVLAALQLRQSTLDAPATVYVLLGTALVIAKHRGNIRRLLTGTENRLEDSPMRQSLLRMIHVLAVGFWFGGAAFFNFVVAPTLNTAYKDVVANAPSDRTAFQPIGFNDDESRKQLASALFGAGVGPVFPKYFTMMLLCGSVAMITSLAWAKNGGVHRWRARVAILAMLTVIGGWFLSNEVAALRRLRYESAAAEAMFVNWHLMSLGLSAVTVLLAGVLLAICAWLPKPLARNASEGL